ncbi:MAG: DUF58 domain-containing protein [Planctomyces sp.]|nr:DUF58 domain-containing protein [Planctomyces sp.]
MSNQTKEQISLRDQQKLLERVRRLKLRCESAIDRDFAGSYDSTVKGSGIEFEETRPYQPGDDVRAMDWRVSARTGIPHIRRFREERRTTLHLIVDGSGSLHLAGRSPYEIATELAALLALLAASEGDQIGLTLFAEAIVRTVPPAGGIEHALLILRELAYHNPRGRGTSINCALEHICRAERRRGVMVLISDFIAEDLEHTLIRAAAQHHIIPVVITDPLDTTLPSSGLLSVRDRETGRTRWIDAFSRRQRRAWKEGVQAANTQRDQLFRRLNLKPLKLDTQIDVPLALRRYLEEGGRV